MSHCGFDFHFLDDFHVPVGRLYVFSVTQSLFLSQPTKGIRLTACGWERPLVVVWELREHLHDGEVLKVSHVYFP